MVPRPETFKKSKKRVFAIFEFFKKKYAFLLGVNWVGSGRNTFKLCQNDQLWIPHALGPILAKNSLGKHGKHRKYRKLLFFRGQRVQTPPP